MPRGDSTKLFFLKDMQKKLQQMLKKKPSLLWDLQYVVQQSCDMSNAACQNLEDKQEYRNKWFDSWVAGMVDSHPMCQEDAAQLWE